VKQKLTFVSERSASKIIDITKPCLPTGREVSEKKDLFRFRESAGKIG